MKKLFSIVVLCLIGLQGVLAQSREISGLVTSADDGLSIPGVSVIIKGTTIGTTTDFDGNYTISVDNEGQTLVFSFVGMKTIELPANSDSINLVMESESIGMDEVMVVAYGTAKKSSFTGSATQIKSDELAKKPVISVGEAIAGMAAGVEVSSGSGQPGSAPSIRVRGIGSINSSNEPLYVIDGVAQTNDNLSLGTSSSLGALSAINPNDIANVTILKDAAAAALYGSRAANGVVLITTKRGKTGKTKFTVKSEMGISDFAVKTLELATPEEAFDYKVLGYKNYLVEYEGMDEAAAATLAKADIGDYFSQYDPTRPDSDYDWDDAMFRQGTTKNVEFSAAGGNEKTKFFASLSYLEADGVAKGSDFSRVAGRLNLDHKATDLIEFGFSSSLSRMKQNVIPTIGYYYVNPLYATRSYLNQLTPIKNTDGSFSDVEGGKKPNLVKENDLNINKNDVWTLTNQGYLQLNLIEGLTFKSTNSMTFTQVYGSKYWAPNSQDGESYNGYAYESNKRRLKLSSSNILNYSTTIDDVHNIDFLVGYEAEKLQDKLLEAEGKNFPNDVKTTLDVASKPLSASFNADGDRMQSILSRFNYNYDNKYYGSISYRTDASSRLGENNRWGSFYSVSGSWRISSESFMEDIDFINDLKLRSSYGVNGTLPTSWVGALGLYDFGANYNDVPGTSYSQIANPDLQWEKNKTFSIATEMRLFDFLNVELEYYHRKTSDLLLQVPVTRTSGFSYYWDNVGEMTNQGLELSVTSHNINNDNFSWNTTLNLAHNKNTIDKLEGGDNVETFPYILREGKSYSSIYLRDWAGVNPTNGHAQWYVLENEKRVDNDNDGESDVTEDSRYAGKKIVGDGNPDLSGSINNSFTYKNFDLSFLITFKIGGDAYIDPYSSVYDDGASLTKAVTKAQLKDYWTTPGESASLPKVVYGSPQNSQYNSSRRLEDASYMRLKSINLGYSLPSEISAIAGLSNIRFYASATNLLTLSKIDDFDPETDSRGTVLSSFDFPPLKTVTFGVQVNF
ncbi:TonB-dependent receptor [Ancylomarina sp. 16SWW S1-10-2]|uniref:SusC/RagA family TonB-linked outer membrane protein n=1 Tax=Ancylomarina sp. 16SWW S1-10-2 TaxID=2499681 RepID=UPI0012ADFD84|nr:TonB-dependent receptor [Ancylomarina sp. 16SWW S1-10-2]MRT91408.1 TonB-dependent receptor [Ancylomarina sp. 16SWW S1-10-2]